MFASLEDTIARAAALVRPRGRPGPYPFRRPGRSPGKRHRRGPEHPPFPRAAMDGFAIVWTGKEDRSPYRVIGTVNPGTRWSGNAGTRDCVKIMTGAAVPPPFDTVIQVEQSQTGADGSVRFTDKARQGQHIAPEGTTPARGGPHPGRHRSVPRHVATLAAVGQWEIPVFERPSVTILPTGSELKEP